MKESRKSQHPQGIRLRNPQNWMPWHLYLQGNSVRLTNRDMDKFILRHHED
jgi:hypothetical protein